MINQFPTFNDIYWRCIRFNNESHFSSIAGVYSAVVRAFANIIDSISDIAGLFFFISVADIVRAFDVANLHLTHAISFSCLPNFQVWETWHHPQKCPKDQTSTWEVDGRGRGTLQEWRAESHRLYWQRAQQEEEAANILHSPGPWIAEPVLWT